MSGTIPLSMTQQFDVYGHPLNGGQLYLYQAGTVATPQNAYQDTGLTIPLPNPITLDAAGRIPQFFLADGQIKIRLQDVNGVVQLAADNILVIGPSAGGGGGGGAVDPTTVMQTGDLKVRYDTSIITGFVRCNGKTIGSATSGAGELADPSAQALFNHLWLKDPNLAVTPGGRGANAAADWGANKQIALPDWRGYALAALDDMGNTAAGRLTAAFFGTPATVLGAASGQESRILTALNLPPYTPAGSIANGAITTTINSARIMEATTLVQIAGGGSFFNFNLITPTATSTQAASSFTGTAQGGTSAPLAAIGPRKLCTFYMKL